MLEFGDAINPDIEQALIWYRKIAHQDQDRIRKEKALERIQILESRQQSDYMLN